MSNDIYEKALYYATKVHEGKFRKGIRKDPYIVHPIEVSNLVYKYLIDTNKDISKLRVVALLHDTIEDCDDKEKTKKEIESIFGTDIYNLVMELTSDKTLQKEMGKTKYLIHKIKNMSEDAKTLKLLDRLSNIKGLKYVDENFKNKYIFETLDIIKECNFDLNKDKNNLIILIDICNEINNLLNNGYVLIKK